MDRDKPVRINLRQKLATFSEQWAPKIVARYNDNEVRLVKTEGEWVWHRHDETDELFLILDGEFDMDFRDGTLTVRAGELLIVPRGVEHRPAARRGEVQLLLIDPNGTPNTGDGATATPAVELGEGNAPRPKPPPEAGGNRLDGGGPRIWILCRPGRRGRPTSYTGDRPGLCKPP